MFIFKSSIAGQPQSTDHDTPCFPWFDYAFGQSLTLLKQRDGLKFFVKKQKSGLGYLIFAYLFVLYVLAHIYIFRFGFGELRA